MIARLMKASLALAFIVVVFGAFVRLSDAGLGCPDWPGCFDQLVGVADKNTATQAYPDADYDKKKAWVEVTHRYIAGLLLLLILTSAILHWRQERRMALPQWLFMVVIAQAILGMLTVTEKLMPAMVSAHLLGGMLILALLSLSCGQLRPTLSVDTGKQRRLRRLWQVATLLLFVQIFLGGWVSANNAGLSCPDFPLCHAGILPPTIDFSGYIPWRQLHFSADGSPISAAALTTIHWTHRIGAVALVAAILHFAVFLRQAGARGQAAGIAAVLILQTLIGIINVMWQLPLWAAVAHNAFAAILIIKMFFLRARLP